MWRCRVTINRVIDGDTFDCDADLGWGVWRRSVKGAPMRVRVLGVNTPERGDERYAEAATLLDGLIGSEVWIDSIALDSFGRALCNVTLADGSNLRNRYPVEWQL